MLAALERTRWSKVKVGFFSPIRCTVDREPRPGSLAIALHIKRFERKRQEMKYLVLLVSLCVFGKVISRNILVPWTIAGVETLK